MYKITLNASKLNSWFSYFFLLKFFRLLLVSIFSYLLYVGLNFKTKMRNNLPQNFQLVF